MGGGGGGGGGDWGGNKMTLSGIFCDSEVAPLTTLANESNPTVFET